MFILIKLFLIRDYGYENKISEINRDYSYENMFEEEY